MSTTAASQRACRGIRLTHLAGLWRVARGMAPRASPGSAGSSLLRIAVAWLSLLLGVVVLAVRVVLTTLRRCLLCCRALRRAGLCSLHGLTANRAELSQVTPLAKAGEHLAAATRRPDTLPQRAQERPQLLSDRLRPGRLFAGVFESLQDPAGAHEAVARMRLVALGARRDEGGHLVGIQLLGDGRDLRGPREGREALLPLPRLGGAPDRGEEPLLLRLRCISLLHHGLPRLLGLAEFLEGLAPAVAACIIYIGTSGATHVSDGVGRLRAVILRSRLPLPRRLLLGAVDAALARSLPLRLWRCGACVFRHARLLLAA
mmetsp:Transcript_97997/g.211241  ORF Transcript_97997/g.211241 Transcript_97997/m.211241 type:complete len:317 (-) Transcript_97997:193-1143(-)